MFINIFNFVCCNCMMPNKFYLSLCIGPMFILRRINTHEIQKTYRDRLIIDMIGL